MGAELARARSGKKTETGMEEEQLKDFAKKPVEHAGRGPSSKHSPHGRKISPRGGY